eukprot:1390148-Rhodomonas_salina.2
MSCTDIPDADVVLRAPHAMSGTEITDFHDAMFGTDRAYPVPSCIRYTMSGTDLNCTAIKAGGRHVPLAKDKAKGSKRVIEALVPAYPLLLCFSYAKSGTDVQYAMVSTELSFPATTIYKVTMRYWVLSWAVLLPGRARWGSGKATAGTVLAG